MLRWLIRNRLAAFERTFSYDMSYARDIVAADLRAFRVFAGVTKLSTYRRDVPRDVYWTTKLVGTLAEDCGPCTQLMVTMALAERTDGRLLAEVIAGRDAALPEDVRLGVAFARAVLAHAPEADDLREQLVARWGPRALVTLAFALTAARVFPTLKYVMGHGRACQRVVIDGQPVAVARGAA